MSEFSPGLSRLTERHFKQIPCGHVMLFGFSAFAPELVQHL